MVTGSDHSVTQCPALETRPTGTITLQSGNRSISQSVFSHEENERIGKLIHDDINTHQVYLPNNLAVMYVTTELILVSLLLL